jgi:DNA polymerase-3 subunit epsilon
LSLTDLETIPESPGVYIFYGQNNVPLYIGKSINLKERILSHFSNTLSSSIEMRISQQIERIETITTSGELGALLKESFLIKQMQPIYNRKLRISRKLLALFKSTTKEGYETVQISSLDSIPVESLDSIMGIFRSKRQVKNFLIQLTQTHQLCEKLLGIEKASTACFGYRLGRCNGACIQEEKPLKYNLRFTEAFSKNKLKPWPFKGPVVIEEKNQINEKNEAIVIDKWCYLGSAIYVL